MNEVHEITVSDVPENLSVAVQVHYEIMTNGRMAANALAEMCRNLKRMRDEKLYLDLGHDSFERYCEDRAGIKSRQAYTYISTYERLGQDVLQSNANVGITKLELLSQLPVSIRDDLLNDPSAVEDISVSEMKKLLDEVKKQSEQISLLEDKAEKQQSEAEKLSEQVKAQKKELAERKELEKKLKEAEKKLKAAESKLEEIETAADPEPPQIQMDEIIEEEKAKVKEEYDGIVSELEKKLKLSGIETVTVKLHMSAIKDEYDKLTDYISGLDEDDQRRYTDSLLGLLTILKADAENRLRKESEDET